MKFFFPILVLFHVLTAGAAMAAAGATADFPVLAAHYRETRAGTGSGKDAADWYFARRADAVETARGDYAEVWKRDARGEIALTRIFHADRRQIHYSGGELRANSRYPDWTALNAILDPREIAALKRVGGARYLGRPAARYRGVVNGERVEVLWLEREAIAAKITRGRGGQRVTLELKALRDAPQPGWPQAALDKAAGYALLDGADLGDMEYDPFVRRVLGHEEHGGHAPH